MDKLATCGAKTRAGPPCRKIDLYANGRCRLHGGLSTGPLTDAGKAIVAANLSHGANPMELLENVGAVCPRPSPRMTIDDMWQAVCGRRVHTVINDVQDSNHVLERCARPEIAPDDLVVVIDRLAGADDAMPDMA